MRTLVILFEKKAFDVKGGKTVMHFDKDNKLRKVHKEDIVFHDEEVVDNS